MINKTIHYIWLGKGKKSKLSEICINSWYNVLGNEYEIKEWNEDNLNLDELRKHNKFLDKCLKYKLWAFASDYLRLYVLYNYGGIYLDTDIQIFQNFDKFLNYENFMGYEEREYICTGVIGAEKNSKLIKRLMDYYDNEILKSEYYINPYIFNYIRDNNPELFENTFIAEKNVFSPYDWSHVNDLPVNKEGTVTIHWYNQGWNLTRKGEYYLRTKHIKNPFKKLYIKLKIDGRRIIRGR